MEQYTGYAVVRPDGKEINRFDRQSQANQVAEGLKNLGIQVIVKLVK